VWLSVDPLASDAPYLTPYRFSFNNPLNVVDPNGMFETDYLNTETGEKIHIEDGIDQTIEVSGEQWWTVRGYQGDAESGLLGFEYYNYSTFHPKAKANNSGNRPTYSALESVYPAYGYSAGPGGGMSNRDFGRLVGGFVQHNIESGNFQNTCALRVSSALNCGSLNPIPTIGGVTNSGGDGSQYIFRVRDMNDYLTSIYGPPNVISSQRSDFRGLNGIILFETGAEWRDATGHTTLWNGSSTVGGRYHAGEYFQMAVKAKLWILP
jgi:hypothetical protein